MRALRSQDEDDDDPGDFDDNETIVPTATSLSADPGERPLGIMVYRQVENMPGGRPAWPKRLIGRGGPEPGAAWGIIWH